MNGFLLIFSTRTLLFLLVSLSLCRDKGYIAEYKAILARYRRLLLIGKLSSLPVSSALGLKYEILIVRDFTACCS